MLTELDSLLSLLELPLLNRGYITSALIDLRFKSLPIGFSPKLPDPSCIRLVKLIQRINNLFLLGLLFLERGNLLPGGCLRTSVHLAVSFEKTPFFNH